MPNRFCCRTGRARQAEDVVLGDLSHRIATIRPVELTRNGPRRRGEGRESAIQAGVFVCAIAHAGCYNGACFVKRRFFRWGVEAWLATPLGVAGCGSMA